MSQRINLAVFGTGRAGHIHISNVLANRRVHLKYLVDVDMDLLEAVKTKFGLNDTQLVLDSKSDIVFDDSSVGGVVVASTTHTHESIVKSAIEKGIAIFCEKPVAESLEKITECYRRAHDKNVVLHCSFNRRFDPSILEFKRHFREEVGQVYTIKSIARDSPIPPIEYLKVSGGIFHDCAVHDFDLICWMLGEWPSTVYAVANAVDPRIRAIDDFDVVSISLKFPSGVLAHIDLTRNSPVGYDQRLEVAGEKGMLLVQNRPKNRVNIFNSVGCHQSPIDFSFPDRYRESYQNSLEHFINLIEGKENLLVTPLSCINVTKLASICEESCRLGKPMQFEPILKV